MENKRVRAKVHMLPTKDKSGVVLHESGKLGYLPRLSLNMDWEFVEKDWTNQHLYFTTDEEIKEGDWVVCLDEIDSTVQNWSVSQAIFKYNNGGNCNSDMKIVATTDTSLELPQPSQAFIQKYCELGGIEEVDLEYDEIEIYSNKGTSNIPSRFSYYQGVTTKIKTDSHNIITIHSIKDSWSREEVEKLLELAWATASAYGDKTDLKDCKDWMRHNL